MPRSAKEQVRKVTSSQSDKNNVKTIAKSAKKCQKKKPEKPYSHKALDKVLLEVQQITQEIEKRENFVKQFLLTPEKQRPLVQQPEPKSEDKDFFEPEKKVEAGLEIIYHKQHACIFSDADELTKFEKGTGLDYPRCGFERCLAQHPELIPELIPDGVYCDGPFSDNFLLFIFRLMSVEADDMIVQSCRNFLLHAAEANHQMGHKWTPSLKDLAIVLTNYGCVAEAHCPLGVLIKISKKYHGNKENSHQHTFMNKKLSLYNLGVVFEFLSQLIKIYEDNNSLSIGLYSDSDLVQMILLLFWLSLDPHTLRIHSQIMDCINTLINNISQNGWDNKWLEHLSMKLSSLADKPEDLEMLYRLLLPAGRSHILKKILSFNAAHICFCAPYTFKPVVTTWDVLRLLSTHPMLSLTEDIKLLRVLGIHIDRAVGNEVHLTDMIGLQKLQLIVKSCAAKLVDSIHCLESSHVKSFLYAVSGKWTIMLQQLEESQQKYPKVTEKPAASKLPDRKLAPDPDLSWIRREFKSRSPKKRHCAPSETSSSTSLNDSLPDLLSTSPLKIPWTTSPVKKRGANGVIASRRFQVAFKNSSDDRPRTRRKLLLSPEIKDNDGMVQTKIPSYWTKRS